MAVCSEIHTKHNTYHSQNATATQSKNCPFAVNTTIPLKNITPDSNAVYRGAFQLTSVPVLSAVAVTVLCLLADRTAYGDCWVCQCCIQRATCALWVERRVSECKTCGIYSNQPFSNQPFSNQPYSNQPYSNQPYSNQPFSNQPYSNQRYNNQPYSNQPYSHQPYSNQP